MTIVDAAKRGSWIKRHRWASWIHVDTTRNLDTSTRAITWADIIADDWQCYESSDQIEPDDTEVRFSLIELD